MLVKFVMTMKKTRRNKTRRKIFYGLFMKNLCTVFAVACGGLWHEWRNRFKHEKNTLLYVFRSTSYLKKFCWTAFNSFFFANKQCFLLHFLLFFCYVVRSKKAMTFGLSYYTFKNTSWIYSYKHKKNNPQKQMNFLLIM